MKLFRNVFLIIFLTVGKLAMGQTTDSITPKKLVVRNIKKLHKYKEIVEGEKIKIVFGLTDEKIKGELKIVDSLSIKIDSQMVFIDSISSITFTGIKHIIPIGLLTAGTIGVSALIVRINNEIEVLVFPDNLGMYLVLRLMQAELCLISMVAVFSNIYLLAGGKEYHKKRYSFYIE